MIDLKKFKLYPEIALLSLLCLNLFIQPLFTYKISYAEHNLVISAIFLACAFSLNKNKRPMLIIAVALIALQWVSLLLNLELLNSIVEVIIVLFFFIIVIFLISQTAASKAVSANIILDSVNGYLLLGMIYALTAELLAYLQPHAFNFIVEIKDKVHFRENLDDFTYYAFITLTTTGYGDIVPLSRAAKSLSILISISGQLYVTILIAMLVGKYISKNGSKV